jgi:tRNA(Arg) A34 adenosine deaminase TadA
MLDGYMLDGYMRMALAEADRAALLGEVPVGAVIVHEGEVLARAHNRREVDRDPLAHAELLVIRDAARRLGRWRLSGCTLVVTLEPCPMCAGAMVNARVDRVVLGAADPRCGAAGSTFDLLGDLRLNHRPEVVRGVMAAACSERLSSFFKTLRRP